jgi:hypothetical protein
MLSNDVISIAEFISHKTAKDEVKIMGKEQSWPVSRQWKN